MQELVFSEGDVLMVVSHNAEVSSLARAKH